MLKTTRFTLWSYRLALPAMLVVVLFVTYCNIMGGGPRDVVSYASGMLSSYLVMLPFTINLLSINATVQFSLSMGQTRRGLTAELPVLNLVFTALMDVICFGGGLVLLRMVLGQWTLSLQGLAVLMLVGGWALGALGQLIGLLGMRFGWKGWVGGFLGLLLAGTAVVLALVAPWDLGEKLTALLQFSAEEATLPATLAVLAAAVVLCAVCHAACWLLLRRYTVK